MQRHYLNSNCPPGDDYDRGEREKGKCYKKVFVGKA